MERRTLSIVASGQVLSKHSNPLYFIKLTMRMKFPHCLHLTISPPTKPSSFEALALFQGCNSVLATMHRFLEILCKSQQMTMHFLWNPKAFDVLDFGLRKHLEWNDNKTTNKNEMPSFVLCLGLGDHRKNHSGLPTIRLSHYLPYIHELLGDGDHFLALHQSLITMPS